MHKPQWVEKSIIPTFHKVVYYLYPRYINMFTFTYVFARYFINLYMILKIEKITRGNKNVPLEMISIQCTQRPFGGKPIRTLMMDGHKNQINQGMGMMDRIHYKKKS